MLSLEEKIIKAIAAGKAVPKRQLLNEGDSRMALKAVGFEVLGNFEGDSELFATELPAGWQIRPNKCGPVDRSFFINWTIVDNRGRRRGELAWFSQPGNDQSWVHVSRRYQTHIDSDTRFGFNCGTVIDRAQDGKVIFRTDYIRGPAPVKDDGRVLVIDCSKGSARVIQELNSLTKKWLDENYPEWEKPDAYWDQKFKG